jgi:hypothetical protein
VPGPAFGGDLKRSFQIGLVHVHATKHRRRGIVSLVSGP